MMNEGLLDEAKKVYPHKNLNALQTVGYKELFSYFDKETSLEFAIEEIKKNTRRFAKRQLTWFKRNSETKWFEYNVNKEEIVEFINNKI
jgi:tRNA dimethylallyltransferase